MKTAAIMADAGSRTPAGSLGGLMLGALGVVYGDIGTSPLYTLKTALEWAGGSDAIGGDRHAVADHLDSADHDFAEIRRGRHARR